jgi:hypothetical protein
MLTVFGLAFPVGAWTLSISKPAALWLAPASMTVLYLFGVRAHARDLEALKGERDRDRASAEDRAIARPDDGAARLTLAKVAEEEGRFDDALDHYAAAHRISDRMFSEHELSDARDRVDVLRVRAAQPKGMKRRPFDVLVMAACAALAFSDPARGLAPLSGLLFASWMRGDLGGD